MRTKKHYSVAAIISLTEVGQLELAFLADEQVLRLDVPVEDAPPVAVAEAAEELKEEELGVARRQTARMTLQVLRQVRVLREEERYLTRTTQNEGQRGEEGEVGEVGEAEAPVNGE